MLAASVSHLFSLVYDYYSSDSSSYCCCCVDGVPMPISWCIAAHAQQQLLLYLGSSKKKRKKTGGWRECWSKEEEEEKRRRYKIFIKTHQAPGWSIIPGAACNSRLLLLLSPVPFAGKWERHKKPRSSPLRKREKEEEEEEKVYEVFHHRNVLLLFSFSPFSFCVMCAAPAAF